MRVLALDTSARDTTVALLENDQVVLERSGDASRPQVEQLPAALWTALAQAGWQIADVDLFAVAAGPGSFTGLRIGIATMQGLATVCGRPLHGVSLLDALAHMVAAQAGCGARIGVWLDAQREEVFSALYEAGAGDPFSRAALTDLERAEVGQPATILSRWRERLPTVLAGDGATRFAALLDGAVRVVARPPLAGAVARLACRAARAGDSGTPAGVAPLYVRRPDVEIARDRHRHG